MKAKIPALRELTFCGGDQLLCAFNAKTNYVKIVFGKLGWQSFGLMCCYWGHCFCLADSWFGLEGTTGIHSMLAPCQDGRKAEFNETNPSLCVSFRVSPYDFSSRTVILICRWLPAEKVPETKAQGGSLFQLRLEGQAALLLAFITQTFSASGQVAKIQGEGN